MRAAGVLGAGNSADTVKFGVNYELTGDFPIIGSSAEEGIKLAVDEINAAGGISVGGKKYKLAASFLDNGFKEAESAVVMQKFADDNGILGVIGPNDSAMCLAAAQIVNDAHLPTITPWATNVDITKTGKFFFRACFTDDFQGAILAKYAYQTAGAKTAASLYDKSNPYNVGVATQFEKTFKELGGKIVESQTYNHGDTDFSAQLTKIISKKADILILPNFYEEVVNQATQARKLGYKGIFIGSDTWGDTSLLTADTEHLLDNAVCIGTTTSTSPPTRPAPSSPPTRRSTGPTRSPTTSSRSTTTPFIYSRPAWRTPVRRAGTRSRRASRRSRSTTASRVRWSSAARSSATRRRPRS